GRAPALRHPRGRPHRRLRRGLQDRRVIPAASRGRTIRPPKGREPFGGLFAFPKPRRFSLGRRVGAACRGAASPMSGDIEVEQREPGALSATERQLWAAFRLSRPELASPYFDLRYVLAAGQAAPGARIAVIRRRGRI